MNTKTKAAPSGRWYVVAQCGSTAAVADLWRGWATSAEDAYTLAQPTLAEHAKKIKVPLSISVRRSQDHDFKDAIAATLFPNESPSDLALHAGRDVPQSERDDADRRDELNKRLAEQLKKIDLKGFTDAAKSGAKAFDELIKGRPIEIHVSIPPLGGRPETDAELDAWYMARNERLLQEHLAGRGQITASESIVIMGDPTYRGAVDRLRGRPKAHAGKIPNEYELKQMMDDTPEAEALRKHFGYVKGRYKPPQHKEVFIDEAASISLDTLEKLKMKFTDGFATGGSIKP